MNKKFKKTLAMKLTNGDNSLNARTSEKLENDSAKIFILPWANPHLCVKSQSWCHQQK